MVKSYNIENNWPSCKHMVPGQKIVAHKTLVNPTKIFLSPFPIKLGLIKKIYESRKLKNFNT